MSESIVAQIPKDCYNKSDDEDCDTDEKELYLSDNGGE